MLDYCRQGYNTCTRLLLVPRLRLGTHCPGGSASPVREGCRWLRIYPLCLRHPTAANPISPQASKTTIPGSGTGAVTA